MLGYFYDKKTILLAIDFSFCLITTAMPAVFQRKKKETSILSLSVSQKNAKMIGTKRYRAFITC